MPKLTKIFIKYLVCWKCLHSGKTWTFFIEKVEKFPENIFIRKFFYQEKSQNLLCKISFNGFRATAWSVIYQVNENLSCSLTSLPMTSSKWVKPFRTTKQLFIILCSWWQRKKFYFYPKKKFRVIHEPKNKFFIDGVMKTHEKLTNFQFPLNRKWIFLLSESQKGLCQRKFLFMRTATFRIFLSRRGNFNGLSRKKKSSRVIDWVEEKEVL